MSFFRNKSIVRPDKVTEIKHFRTTCHIKIYRTILVLRGDNDHRNDVENYFVLFLFFLVLLLLLLVFFFGFFCLFFVCFVCLFFLFCFVLFFCFLVFG